MAKTDIIIGNVNSIVNKHGDDIRVLAVRELNDDQIRQVYKRFSLYTRIMDTFGVDIVAFFEAFGVANWSFKANKTEHQEINRTSIFESYLCQDFNILLRDKRGLNSRDEFNFGGNPTRLAINYYMSSSAYMPNAHLMLGGSFGINEYTDANLIANEQIGINHKTTSKQLSYQSIISTRSNRIAQGYIPLFFDSQFDKYNIDNDDYYYSNISPIVAPSKSSWEQLLRNIPVTIKMMSNTVGCDVAMSKRNRKEIFQYPFTKACGWNDSPTFLQLSTIASDYYKITATTTVQPFDEFKLNASYNDAHIIVKYLNSSNSEVARVEGISDKAFYAIPDTKEDSLNIKYDEDIRTFVENELVVGISIDIYVTGRFNSEDGYLTEVTYSGGMGENGITGYSKFSLRQYNEYTQEEITKEGVGGDWTDDCLWELWEEYYSGDVVERRKMYYKTSNNILQVAFTKPYDISNSPIGLNVYRNEYIFRNSSWEEPLRPEHEVYCPCYADALYIFALPKNATKKEFAAIAPPDTHGGIKGNISIMKIRRGSAKLLTIGDTTYDFDTLLERARRSAALSDFNAPFIANAEIVKTNNQNALSGTIGWGKNVGTRLSAFGMYFTIICSHSNAPALLGGGDKFQLSVELDTASGMLPGEDAIYILGIF